MFCDKQEKLSHYAKFWKKSFFCKSEKLKIILVLVTLHKVLLPVKLRHVMKLWLVQKTRITAVVKQQLDQA